MHVHAHTRTHDTHTRTHIHVHTLTYITHTHVLTPFKDDDDDDEYYEDVFFEDDFERLEEALYISPTMIGHVHTRSRPVLVKRPWQEIVSAFRPRV
jgi:hypothetical protein